MRPMYYHHQQILTTDFSNSGTSVRVFEGSNGLTYDALGTMTGKYKVDAVGTNATPANPLLMQQEDIANMVI